MVGVVLLRHTWMSHSSEEKDKDADVHAEMVEVGVDGCWCSFQDKDADVHAEMVEVGVDGCSTAPETIILDWTYFHCPGATLVVPRQFDF